MTEPTPHLGDEIQELLDGRLDPAREAVVRSHLAECDVCREHWQHLEWLKERLRAMASSAPLPADLADLEAAIRGALDRERPELRADAAAHLDQVSTGSTTPSSSPSSLSPPRRAWRSPLTRAAGLAALLVVTIGAGLWWWFRPPTPVEIGDDYVALAEGTLRIEAATADPRALERYFTAQGDVPNRVYDLDMMRYTLVGGRLQPHRGQPGTLAVYRGAHGERVICEMYYAAPPSAAPVDRRTHKGIEFTVYRHGDVIMVFWDEGPVTCVLAAILDPEALLQLAFAKAQRQA
jgi:anti-sigma factor RsiW